MLPYRPSAILPLVLLLLSTACCLSQETQDPDPTSGVYPHLAMWNDHGECGTGAVVPWAGKLWAITYAPHQPNGSTDKLYSIDSQLKQQIFEGSVGGTPANRMIHRESQQLIIGPYFISAQGKVRTIPPSKMPGRLTGVARHLTDPENKVYFATMEEGIYEVNVHSLEVRQLFADHQEQIDNPNKKSIARVADLPGYHGKGLYSGQGRLIYANNGEPTAEARQRPDVPSGCLAQWDGTSASWQVVRRNQFTDVCGPGGLHGNSNSATDPVWAIGWDHRSLILMLLDNDQWHTYRLPKASNCYDGAHGWNTEWPRFRKVGQDQFLLNMHGMFWDFPSTFSLANSAGIRPKSTYLKVIGDYCRWNNNLVLGCDDTAANEFLNKRKAKGTIAGPGQSHSNLWFVAPEQLNSLGTPIGNGAVWLDDAVQKNQPSDRFLFTGFDHRQLCLTNSGQDSVSFRVEIDPTGDDSWQAIDTLVVTPNKPVWQYFPAEQSGVWIRLVPLADASSITAQFSYRNENRQALEASSKFTGVATTSDTNVSNGLVRVRGDRMKTLAFVPEPAKGEADSSSGSSFYELDEQLNLKAVKDNQAEKWHRENLQIPKNIIQHDNASAIFIDDEGNHWRLPRNLAGNLDPPTGRIAREVVTERDLFHCGGTFYELPARNAGGIRKVRPICTHGRQVFDFCSYRGLMVMTGINLAGTDSKHIIRSDDGKAALWVGVIDDLWEFGKPRGVGGPWNQTLVSSGVPSDPYLIHGFDSKTLNMSVEDNVPVTITVEVDITGDGDWVQQSIHQVDRQGKTYQFPAGFSAYWVRFIADKDAKITTELTYR